MSAEALIAAIVAEPDQEAPWLVYADWLLERGDVRGELIHFALDGTEGALRRMSFLEQDLEPLLSPRLFARRSHWRLGWRRGFIWRASTDKDCPVETEALAALCADPHAVLLETLFLGRGHRRLEQVGAPPVVELEAVRVLPYLEQLTVTDVRASQLANPHLRRLTTDAFCTFAITGTYDLPELEYWAPTTSEALFTTPTSLLFTPPPKLRTLELALDPQRLELLAALQSQPPVVVDAMSRTADGRIDAIGAWIRGPHNQGE